VIDRLRFLMRTPTSWQVWRRRCGLRWDALRFSRQRAVYYEYLADLVDGLQGRKTMRDIFDDDAHRYGPGACRGRLARRWSEIFEESGGNIAQTWQGSFPADELSLLRAAQAAGAGALTATLRDLARAAALIEQARGVLVGACSAGVAALAVAIALAAAVPFFTVPRLQHVFQVVPAAMYGGLTQGLFGLADLIRYALPIWLAGAAASLWLVAWSMPNFAGPLRTRLDRFLIWRLYRDFHSIRFLAMLTILVRQRGNVDTRLREALMVQAQGACPWFAWHIDGMVARIDAGLVGGDTFDTGLIDAETWWYLADMIAAHGMETGTARARQRVEVHTLARVRRHALALRWCLLLAAVAAVMGLALWHYAVIDELRRAMTNLYASG
jgi:hypothetical protein